MPSYEPCRAERSAAPRRRRACVALPHLSSARSPGRPSAAPARRRGHASSPSASGRPSRPSSGTARAGPAASTRRRGRLDVVGLPAGVRPRRRFVAGHRAAARRARPSPALPRRARRAAPTATAASRAAYRGRRTRGAGAAAGTGAGGATPAQRAGGLVLGVHARGLPRASARTNPSATTSSSGRTAASSSSDWSATVATPPTSRITWRVSTSSRSASCSRSAAITRSCAPRSTWHLVRIGESGSPMAEVILAGPPLCRLISRTYSWNQPSSRSRGGPSKASVFSTASLHAARPSSA